MKTRQYKYSIGTMIKRLMLIAKPQKKDIVISTLASIVGNLSHMGMMGFGSALILFSIGRFDAGSKLLWGGLTLLCALLIAIMRFYEGVNSHVAAYNLLAEMRTDLFKALRRLAPAYSIDRPKGDILSVAVADIDVIESFFAHSIGPMFTVILLPLTSLIVAGSVHMLFVAALLPIYLMISVVIPLLAMKAGRKIGMDYRERVGSLKSNIVESVYGLKDIQIFGYSEERMKGMIGLIDRVNSSSHGLVMHRQLVTSLPGFFISLARILIVFIALHLGSSNSVDFSRVVILSFVVSASFSSTQSLISVISKLLETFAAAERYFEIEDEKPMVSEKEDAVNIDSIEEYSLNGVSFSYKADSNTILDDICLKLEKGDKIGIIGESGEGKSTILRLMLRFWDPVSGTICAGEKDIKNVTLSSLRNRIAMVEQSTFIYDGTIAENIAYGKPQALKDEIISAAQRAGLHKMIENLPDGYDTQMGEYGNRLSGGEKQRVGLARILLTDPDMIVMDEPTSNLDVFNEKLLLKTLREEYPDKTVVIVSHRMSTLTDCNTIYKLQEGKLSKVEI